MNILPDKNYFKPLDEFFAKKTIQDINRDTYLVCNLHDKPRGITISLIFLRDWDSIESDTFNQVIIEGKGVVFTFPGYWISVPKELSYEYFVYIINAFYTEYVSKWINNNGGNSGVNNIPVINNNCNCAAPCNFI